jgi:DNA-3-methyladenine glycosylase II
MSSRRSARLSEASPNLKQASSAANDMPPPQVANISKKRKNPSKDDVPDAAPSTPKRKKATRPVPPMTPTPSAIGLMTAPYSSGDIDDSTPPPLNRLAVPNGTNAPLVTPETHRLLANKAVDQVSPSKKGNIKSTTGTLLEEALAHLVKVEPRLKAVIEKHHCHVFSPEGLAEEIDPFRSLVSGIISQQVRSVNSISWSLYSLKYRSLEQQPRASKLNSWLSSTRMNQMQLSIRSPLRPRSVQAQLKCSVLLGFHNVKQSTSTG